MENSKLQKWALGAEIIGGMAVIVSIGFVAFELNQSTDEAALNRNALEISTYQNLIESVINLNSMIVSDPDFAKVIITSRDGPEALSSEDLFRLRIHYRNIFRHGDMAYFQYERGAIDQERLDQVLAVIRGHWSANPVARDSWNAFKGGLPQNYVHYLDEFLK